MPPISTPTMRSIKNTAVPAIIRHFVNQGSFPAC